MQFSNLYEHQMVQDMVCFYSPSEQKLQYVIRLGRYDFEMISDKFNALYQAVQTFKHVLSCELWEAFTHSGSMGK